MIRMFTVRPRPAVPTFAAMLIAVLAVCATPVFAQVFRAKDSLPDMVQEADAITIATCTKKEVIYRNGNIVSRYNMKPSEFIKGSMQLSSAGEFVLEQKGGSIEKPIALTQMVPTSAQFKTGQEVLLFTQAPRLVSVPTAAVPQKSQAAAGAAATVAQPIVTGPALVNADHGVFSVVSNPETGEKLIIQGSTAGRLNNSFIDNVIKAKLQKDAEKAKADAKAGKAKSVGAASAQSSAAAASAGAAGSGIEQIQKLSDFSGQVESLIRGQAARK